MVERVKSDARFEAELPGGVALYDISQLLPRGRGHYLVRRTNEISTAFIHKSGADGKPGFFGAVNMAHFCTEQRGWPGAPYHFWGPRDPDRDAENRPVIYRCQRDEVRSFHTGGKANGYGISYACQGAYDGEWDLLSSGRPKVEVEPSEVQMQCLEAWVEWAIERYKLKLPEGLSGHWEAPIPKKVCPGDFIRQWVIDRRGQAMQPYSPPVMVIPRPHEVPIHKPTVKQLQKALLYLGYRPGEVDGIWGYKSRAALEAFQQTHGLVPDGWYGPRTAAALLGALQALGFSNAELYQT